MTIDWKNTLEAELSALRTAAIADAAEIERLKAQNAELLAENKRLKFQADVIDALNDVAYCNGYQFGAQEMCAKYRKEADESIDRRRTVAKAAIAKARGDELGVQS